MNAVELENISKSFGSVLAVAQLSLQVPEGTIYGFIGPNGSGKTTTLRVLLNIFKPDAGAVRLFGNPSLGVRDPRLGYLPEERGLYRRMNVRELLCFFGKLKTGRLLEREVDTWLERFGLREWGGKSWRHSARAWRRRSNSSSPFWANPGCWSWMNRSADWTRSTWTSCARPSWISAHAGPPSCSALTTSSMAERMCDFICMIFQGRKVLDGTLRSIQDQFGADTVRLRVDGGAARLHDLPGVEHLDDFGQVQELRLRPGADPQQILAHLVARIPIQSFELTRPSLHDIFVRIAGPRGHKGHPCVEPSASPSANTSRRSKPRASSSAFFLAPLLMCGGLIGVVAFRGQVDIRDKRIAIVDRSGLLTNALFQAAEQRNNQEVHAKTGKKVKPAYVLERVEPATDDGLAQRWRCQSVCVRALCTPSWKSGRRSCIRAPTRSRRVTYHAKGRLWMTSAAGWNGL